MGLEVTDPVLLQLSKIKRRKDESKKIFHAECQNLLVLLSDMSKIQFQIKHGFLSMP